ncbi:hypothetical protein SORBI_3003G218450 [Sorghum bicolor]|uniref:Uncharacterized protein n=1 Tax=Sorghum bicolor TaxID=4558 RepID=A0A1W0VYF4_SORBI|nr:hypothetical protein SORBI_3003G218450 [Sorghum bicolor]
MLRRWWQITTPFTGGERTEGDTRAQKEVSVWYEGDQILLLGLATSQASSVLQPCIAAAALYTDHGAFL